MTRSDGWTSEDSSVLLERLRASFPEAFEEPNVWVSGISVGKFLDPATGKMVRRIMVSVNPDCPEGLERILPPRFDGIPVSFRTRSGVQALVH